MPESFELLESVLQDLQRLETRLQVVAPALQVHRLVEVGFDIGQQLPVAEVGPGPARQGGAEQGHRQRKGRQSQPLLAATGLAPDQVAVRKDHAREQILEKEAVARGDAGVLQAGAGEAEALFDARFGIAAGFALLQGAGEIETAEDRFELEGLSSNSVATKARRAGLSAANSSGKASRPGGMVVPRAIDICATLISRSPW